MHGIPVVTTISGAEGLPLDIAGMITITNDPAEMSAALIDAASCRDSSEQAKILKEKAAGYFSEEVATKNISRIFKSITGD